MDLNDSLRTHGAVTQKLNNILKWSNFCTIGLRTYLICSVHGLVGFGSFFSISMSFQTADELVGQCLPVGRHAFERELLFLHPERHNGKPVPCVQVEDNEHEALLQLIELAVNLHARIGIQHHDEVNGGARSASVCGGVYSYHHWNARKAFGPWESMVLCQAT